MTSAIGLTPIDLLTTILVVITGVYAWLTYKIAHSNKMMVIEIQKQIEVQTRPVIALNIEIQHRG